MSQEQDYYRILGISRDAPDREVKRAYYALARELHPDKAASPEEARTNQDRLAIISQAYNTLKDPVKRAEYDSTIKGKPSAPASATQTGRPSMPAGARPAQPPPSAAGAAAPAGAQPPAAGAEGSKLSNNELAAQRVAMAQKAFVRGMQHFKLNEWEKAKPFFEAAIQNDPESEPHYHVKYAMCLVKTKGSMMRAVEAMEKAIALDTYNIEFKISLAEIWEQAGSLSNAIKIYEDVLRWDAENSRAKTRLLSLKQQEAKEANAKKGVLEKLLPSMFGKKK